jgi:hypothetical protein
MAVDTRNERAACIYIGKPYAPVYPNPDGTISSREDRQHIAGAYPTILAQAAELPADITWQFLVDWDDDGDYDLPVEDITNYVIGARWNLGMRQPYQLLADESRCDITLRNEDKRFSPENNASPLYGLMLPMRLMTVRSVWNGGTRTHWTGWTDIYEVQPMRYRERTASISGIGAKEFFQRQEVYLSLQSNVTVDQVLAEIISQVQIPPASGAAWYLESDTLDETTYLGPDITAYTNFETGITTLPYTADNWEDGIDAYRAIGMLMEAEQGRFFFDRNGIATFWNRHHLALDTRPPTTFNETFQDLTYEYGANLVSIVRATVHPRKISASNTELLWELDKPLTLTPGERKTIRARFSDPDTDATIAAQDVIKPNTANGSLSYTGNVSFVRWEVSARSAEMEFINIGTTQATISVITIRGRKITSYKKVDVEAVDGPSLGRYGKRVHTLRTTLLDDEEFARMLCQYTLNRLKSPVGQVVTMTLMNRDAATVQQQITRTIGDKIRIVDTQTEHDGTYFIIGESHELRAGAKHLISHYTLEPADTAEYWILETSGHGELDTGTILAL